MTSVYCSFFFTLGIAFENKCVLNLFTGLITHRFIASDDGMMHDNCLWSAVNTEHCFVNT